MWSIALARQNRPWRNPAPIRYSKSKLGILHYRERTDDVLGARVSLPVAARRKRVARSRQRTRSLWHPAHHVQRERTHRTRPIRRLPPQRRRRSQPPPPSRPRPERQTGPSLKCRISNSAGGLLRDR